MGKGGKKSKTSSNKKQNQPKLSLAKSLKVKGKGKVVLRNLKQLNLKSKIKIDESDEKFKNIREEMMKGVGDKKTVLVVEPKKIKRTELMDTKDMDEAVENLKKL